MKTTSTILGATLILALTSTVSQAQLLWTVGTDDNGWPAGTGGGPTTSFVQENGAINALPGSPVSTSVPRGADNDYYFAGDYSTLVDSAVTFYGDYSPVGAVDVNEEAAERAFAGGDNDLRYHFNLPESLQPTDRLSVTFDALNLDTGGHPESRYGVAVYFNGVLVQPEILIRPAQIGKVYQSPQFTVESVNARVGVGYDNVISLKGVSYSADGGGAWMGIDHIKLEQSTEVIPPPSFPWAVGLNDDGWPTRDGGGPNATFVQENGAINPLPGSPISPEIAGQGDNDYYFGGSYTATIPSVVATYGAYTPVGVVSANEESAERAFAGGDNDLRYHFNLPNELKPTDPISISFEAMNLDDTAAEATRRYGVEVYFNGILVQPEIVVRPGQLGKTLSTPAFTLSSVQGQVGPGFDNIVSLKGINHSADGGGSWMGFDYVQLNTGGDLVIQAPTLPLQIGLDDNNWPGGDGGGANATFVQENGTINPLPGSATSPEINGQGDNDYYFAGNYTTIIPSVAALYGTYSPVGPVTANEESAERAFAGGDNDLRYHFNLPANLKPTDQLAVRFDSNNLDDSAAEATRRYGVEIYFNGVLVQPQILVRPPLLDTDFTSLPFTLESVNAQVGAGYDNVVSLKGINYSADGGGNWMGIDYVQIKPVIKPTFPWVVGVDDNDWPTGNGGGPNTTFVQENGTINALPGSPTNPEINQQGDNDYYFAGDYTTAIDSVTALYGAYTPAGLVIANEETAERAFAAADNDLRYHFNLPSDLTPDTLLTVTLDPMNLHTDGQADPRYGVQVYFNGVLVQDELIIRPADLNVQITVPPFTAASVNAQVGSGYDNIVSVKGINYNNDGGGNWMGIDHVMLSPVSNSPFPLAVGRDDNGFPVGNGGGPDATFVQETGAINVLPGRWTNPERDGRADNDYYFAGDYSTPIDSVTALYGNYTPVGLVPVNEEAAERAFAGGDLDLRYHFNLPPNLGADDLLTVTFDANSLDEGGADPRYGVEVYFNGVLVQSEILIHPAELDTDYTTEPFSLASVNAQVGRGFDNVVSLKGVSYNGSGGGNWMGIDYVQINPIPLKFLPIIVTEAGTTLDWTGVGQLESAPAISGPWTPVAGANRPHIAPIVAGQNRFFRLTRP